MCSDIYGCVREDLAIAVPAAVGGQAAAGRVVPADLAEEVLAVLPQVQLQLGVALAMTRCETEAPDAVHLHEAQVELVVLASVT